MCRKVPSVLQYHVPNINKRPEDYYHHMLVLFYPFCREEDLMCGNPPSYSGKFYNSNVLEILNHNQSLVEPYADLVHDAFQRYNEDSQADIDPFRQQENSEVEPEFQDQNSNQDLEEINCTTLSFNYSGNIAHQDHEISKAIRSLNKEQREVFDVVHKWSRDYIKQRSSKHPKEVKLFYIFLTGSAGVGKSHVTKTITMSLNKGLMRNGVNPDRPRVLILAPTGVAAININGRTVHSGLGLGIGKDFFSLNDKQRGILRNKLSEVKLVIIDEISMVSSILFWQLNQRLQEIFGCKNKPFAGLPVIVCGDLCQLPAVNGAPIFNSKSSVKGLLTQDLWRMFCMAELTEVMRQRKDFQFIQIINKIREGNCDEEVETILKSRFFSQPSDQFPKNGLHVFAQNAPVNEHNQIMLDKTESQFIIVPAIDILPKDCNMNIESLQKRKLSETENLASLLKLKVGAQIMLTKNIDIDDKLVNGALRKVMNF